MALFAPIKLKCDSVAIAFGVEASHTATIQELADAFSAKPADILSPVELHAAFIQHCVDSGNVEAALAVFFAFCRTFDTSTRNIHVVAQAHGLDEDAARRVLKGYFSTWPLVNSNSDPSSVWPVSPSPALFSSESVGLMAMFGGQRGTSSYLDEAVWLLDVYRPLLLDFVTCMSEFLQRESKDKRVASMYFKGFDVLRWLTVANAAPSKEYLLLSPICMPLFGFIQLMHIMILYKTLGVSPGDLVKSFKGKLYSVCKIEVAMFTTRYVN
ncbi:fatty acid synthase alpha subunit Lsd1 [Coemansia aciculifera]|uniref:Fatty acid synthase alpha subunit Lsd1 n=1 Tax=Coemansia aciculifera TaxID=417176 RepID=A0ACC1LZY7_9FUNG|nr:fatty acid synthase alpha subunit Lsd1 [Coemansia aciculifera]